MSDNYFRVIKIISKREIIINAGNSNDLALGDKIEIIVPGSEILDPFNNNKKLGALDYVKDILEIKRITPTYSICHKVKPIITKKSNAFSTISDLSKIMNGEIEYVETPINIDENEITNGYPENVNKQIRIGDYAQKSFE